MLNNTRAAEYLSSIPSDFRDALIEEFNKVLRNYRESRWEATSLAAAKFAEVVYSIIRGHVDQSFPEKPKKPKSMIAACNALEQHASQPRSIRIQIPKMLIALYEIRNERSVGHIGSDVDPNKMDASVALSISKWVMAEIVRIFHSTTTEEAETVVSSIVQRSTPLVWSNGEIMRVLDPKMTVREQALILIYSHDGPISVPILINHLEYKNASRFRKAILAAAHKDRLIEMNASSDTVCISPLGMNYVEDNLFPNPMS